MRFTNRYSNGKAFIMNCALQTTNGIEDAIEKLADYEDLEEQGLLLRLPCKVGDRVYVPTRNFVSEYTIRSIEIFRNNIFFNWVCDEGIYKRIDGFPEFELGESVFLTKEAAEKKLAEMEK